MSFPDKVGFWMTRYSTVPDAYFNVCQMCLVPVDPDKGPLCLHCCLTEVAPTAFTLTNDGVVHKPDSEVRCLECGEATTPYERIILYCCKRLICLECYVDHLHLPTNEQPDKGIAPCPLCERDTKNIHPMLVIPAAIQYFFFWHPRLFPGILEYYDEMTVGQIESKIRSDAQFEQQTLSIKDPETWLRERLKICIRQMRSKNYIYFSKV